uniref:F-box domain-containing protein n=1 Tax=Schizophyllum commune (strain H4-8 / FGSC 9210) TaxID=578458 RepID=D8Q7F7_SCHCM
MDSSGISLSHQHLERVPDAMNLMSYKALVKYKTMDDAPDETLFQIVSYCDKRTLLVLATVNKRLSAITMLLIWRDLPSPAPLMRLVPNYFSMQKIPVPTSLADDGPPPNLSKDYPRVLHFASLVRTLLLYPIDGLCYYVAQHGQATTAQHITMLVTWGAFNLFAQSLALLPDRPFKRLQHLEVNSIKEATFQGRLLSRFISPSTTTLVTHCPVSQMGAVVYGSAIQSLSYREQPLFYGEVAPHVDVLHKPSLAIFAQMPNFLRELVLYLHYGRGLGAFLRRGAHTLRVLDIEIGKLVDRTTDYGLRRLQQLTVRNSSAAFARSLVGSPSLEQIHLSGLVVGDSSEMRTIFTRLGRECFPTVLHVVRVQERFPSRGSTSWNVSLLDLAPLLPFVGLTRLEICASADIVLWDADYDSFVPSWPNLRVFKLQSYDASSRPPSLQQPVASLAALIPFAVSCHQLRELSLPLHVDAVPELQSGLALGECCLTTLDLGTRSVMGVEVDPMAVGGFLRALFPVLFDLDITPKGEDVDT